MKDLIKAFIMDEQGQGMVEYGLIIALIAVVVITVLTTMGNSIKSKYNEINGALGGTTTSP